MSKRREPNESGRYAGVERRQRPRHGTEPTDWETIALKRVAHRVQSLSADNDSSLRPSLDHGWEEVAVLALRRRLRELKSE